MWLMLLCDPFGTGGGIAKSGLQELTTNCTEGDDNWSFEASKKSSMQFSDCDWVLSSPSSHLNTSQRCMKRESMTREKSLQAK